MISIRISAETSKTEEQSEIISYGLKILLFEAMVPAFIVIISCLLGICKYSIFTSIVFALLRFTAGGIHARSRIECFLEYSIFIFLTVYLAITIQLSFSVYILFFIIILTVLIMYAPGDTDKKPINSKKQKKRLKKAAILILVILYAVAIPLKALDTALYNMILLSSFYSMLLLTPLAYKITGCKNSIKNNRKGCV